MTTARLVLLAALLASPLHADSAKRLPLWPGAAWAVVPTGADALATAQCVKHHTCAEQNAAGGTMAWTAAAMTAGVVLQTHIDRSIREHGGGWRLWVLRLGCAMFHGYLAVHAYRIDHAGRAR